MCLRPSARAVAVENVRSEYLAGLCRWPGSDERALHCMSWQLRLRDGKTGKMNPRLGEVGELPEEYSV
jgi:hypothetical protein